MDAVVNGEFSEEFAEKENVSNKNVETVSCSSVDNSTVNKSNALCLTKENSTISSNSEAILLLNETAKDANISIQESNVDTSKLSTSMSVEVNFDGVSDNCESSKDNPVDLENRSDEKSTTDSKVSDSLIKQTDFSEINTLPCDKKSTIDSKVPDSLIKQTDFSEINILPCDKKSTTDDKVSDSLIKQPDFSEINTLPCDKESHSSPLSTSNGETTSVQKSIYLKEENNEETKLDNLNKNEESPSPRVLNDSSTNLCNKKNQDSSEISSAAIPIPSQKLDDQKNEKVFLSSTGSITNNNEDAEMSELNSSIISNNKHGSDPLEQLNERLKSLGGSSSDNMHDYSVTKTCIPNKFDDCSDKPDSVSIKDSTTSLKRQKDADSFVFTEISNEESGFPEVFAGLVTIGKYISVKGDFTLRSSEALVESASLIAPYLLKEPDIFPPRATSPKNDQRGFFYSTAGEFLIGIGLSRVNEWYHRDMTRIKKRIIKKEGGKSPQHEEDLKLHETFYTEAKKANRMYSFPLKFCKTCGFATESSLVMEGHLLVPHVTQRREFQCNFCDVINRDPKGMLEHMYRVHSKTGRIQPPLLFFECPYCTFESNSKVKLGNHLTKCQRFYDPNRNQAPPKDFEFPALTPKPITVAVVKAYEKSLSSMQRGRGRPKKLDNICEQMNQFASMGSSPMVSNPIPPYRPSSTPALSESLSNLTNQMLSPLQMPNMNLRPPHSSMTQLRAGMPPMHLSSSNRLFQVVNSSSQMMPMFGNNSFVTAPSQFPFTSNLVNSASKKIPGPTPTFLNSLFGSSLRQPNLPKSVPEVTITPLPKLQGPYPVPHVKATTPPNNTSVQGNSLVVCEICDGYIKDLEQLRSHMQLIHKVKIHPKMLVSRPPLNCQKCQWRFFTDQGLERHLLGSHGLVTSNMQELANKSKDAGCCTICGRVYASKLVSHMNQVHKLILKPAHLSYKCTVCSATFNLYRLFENHVYLVHSGAAKRSADGSSNPSKKFKSTDADNCDQFFEGEPNNHTGKRTLEGITNCKECGKEFRKIVAQMEKCEKCLSKMS